MNIVYSTIAEDIYMNYSQMLTFDSVFSTQILDSLSNNVSYNVDNSNGRITFNIDFENYQIKGYVDSSRVQLKSDRYKSNQYSKEFIQKVSLL